MERIYLSLCLSVEWKPGLCGERCCGERSPQSWLRQEVVRTCKAYLTPRAGSEALGAICFSAYPSIAPLARSPAAPPRVGYTHPPGRARRPVPNVALPYERFHTSCATIRALPYELRYHTSASIRVALPYELRFHTSCASIRVALPYERYTSNVALPYERYTSNVALPYERYTSNVALPYERYTPSVAISDERYTSGSSGWSSVSASIDDLGATWRRRPRVTSRSRDPLPTEGVLPCLSLFFVLCACLFFQLRGVRGAAVQRIVLPGEELNLSFPLGGEAGVRTAGPQGAEPLANWFGRRNTCELVWAQTGGAGGGGRGVGLEATVVRRLAADEALAFLPVPARERGEGALNNLVQTGYQTTEPNERERTSLATATENKMHLAFAAPARRAEPPGQGGLGPGGGTVMILRSVYTATKQNIDILRGTSSSQDIDLLILKISIFCSSQDIDVLILKISIFCSSQDFKRRGRTEARSCAG